MDELDRRILDALQTDFPLEEQPFDIVAARLAVDADELWRRVQQMCGDGTIRRLGASLNSRKLGFAGTLAAISVPADVVEQAAATVAAYTEVTHSYLRDHKFNIWFTIIAWDAERIEAILDEIRTGLKLEPTEVLNLPMTRQFKLDARFTTRH
jgi:DNA-binding Lrp family transcriptional regulator